MKLLKLAFLPAHRLFPAETTIQGLAPTLPSHSRCVLTRLLLPCVAPHDVTVPSSWDLRAADYAPICWSHHTWITYIIHETYMWQQATGVKAGPRG